MASAICILGMHRSGTSTVARALNLVGAYLGEDRDIMSPASDNPEGFWEHNDIVALNERILKHFNMSWDTALPMPSGWHRSAEVKQYRDELKSLVERNFSNRELWAWKDPRTTLLFDIWRDVLDEMGIEVVCLFTVRNPLDVARSLEKRNKFSLPKSFGIWLNYNLSALNAAAGLKIAFLSYDNFLSAWEFELRRCASVLGIKWPPNDIKLKDEMEGFLRSNLRHSLSGIKELENAGAPKPVIKLNELLNTLLLSEGYGYEKETEELFITLRSFSEFYVEDCSKKTQLENRILELEIKLSEGERLLSEKEQIINALLTSYSWKVTSPLRSALKFLKG